MHHQGAVADRPGWVCTTPSRSMLRRVTPNRSESGLYPNVPCSRRCCGWRRLSVRRGAGPVPSHRLMAGAAFTYRGAVEGEGRDVAEVPAPAG